MEAAPESSANGGVATAAGLRFQYLAAVDALLDALSTGHDFEFTTEDDTNDVVDFAVRPGGDAPVIVAQAKAAVDGALGDPVGVTEFVEIAVRLVDVNADRRRIVTNRRPGPSTTRMLSILRASSLPLRKEAVIGSVSYRSRAAVGALLAPLSDDQLQRLRTVELDARVDERRLDESVVAERVRSLRRIRSVAIGTASSMVLIRYLVAEVLRMSSSRIGRSLTESEASALIMQDSRVLATVLGKYEIGGPIGRVPQVPSVRRPDEERVICSALPPDHVERRVRRLVLTGASGIGKSALARWYEDTRAGGYDVRLWIDASTESTIEADIRDFLGATAPKDGPVDQAFRAFLEHSPATWLLVFDNARSRATVERWLPAVGHVDVLATAVDPTAWSGWTRCSIPEMRHEEALALLFDRLGGAPTTVEEMRSATRITEGLGYWPLALELAGAYLSASGRGLHATDDYIRELTDRIADDPGLMPAEYVTHPTLLGAVFIALDDLRRRDAMTRGLRAQRLLEAATVFDLESIPLAIAVRTAALVEANDAVPERSPSAIEIDDACLRLHATALAKRSTAAGPYSERLRINDVVAHVVRQLFSEEDLLRCAVLAQVVLDDVVRSAGEQRNFAAVHTLVPSARALLSIGTRLQLLTPFALLLLGNIAGAFAVGGQHRNALALLTTELELLEVNSLDAPVLRAKIEAQRLRSLLYVDPSPAQLEAALTAAIEAAVVSGLNAESEPELPEVERAWTQVTSIIHQSLNLVESTGHLPIHIVETAREHFSKWAGNSASDPWDVDGVEGLLRAGAAPQQILERLQAVDDQSAPLEARVQRAGLLIEVLAELHLWQRVEVALDAALALTESNGLGVGAIRDALINCLRPAAQTALLLGDLGALSLEGAIRAVLERDEPDTPVDQARAAVFGMAIRAATGPLGELEACFAAVDAASLVPGARVRSTVFDLQTLGAVRRVLDMRVHLDGSPVLAADIGVARFDDGRGLLRLRMSRVVAEAVRSSVDVRVASAKWAEHPAGLLVIVSDDLHRIAFWASRAGSLWYAEAGDAADADFCMVVARLNDAWWKWDDLQLSEQDGSWSVTIPLAGRR